MNEFKRMIIKVSDVTNQVATIPTTNDHTDGSWLNTDIYVGELFLNITDDVLQTRTDVGIVVLNPPSTGGAWGTITGTLSNQTDLQNALDNKQDNLVSGTNIKTINNNTVLGSGNLVINTTDAWGDITGTLSNQTDLQNALDDKQNILVSGTNIKTINGNTVLGSGNLLINTTDAWGDITGTLSNQTDLQNALNDKQDNLVSGTNIKTINGNTVLGSGDLAIETTDDWGDINGTLSNQTDLQNALDDKQNILVSGQNIKTVGGNSILGSGNIPLGVTSIVAGTNVTISPSGGTGAVTINSAGGGGGGSAQIFSYIFSSNHSGNNTSLYYVFRNKSNSNMATRYGTWTQWAPLYYVDLTMPADCFLKSFTIRGVDSAQWSSGLQIRMKIFKNRYTVEYNGSFVTSSGSGDTGQITFDLTSSDTSFSAGDTVGIGFNCTGNMGGIIGTPIFELT